MVLSETSPQLVVESANTTCSDGSTGCGNSWLLINWGKVWEQGVSGSKVK